MMTLSQDITENFAADILEADQLLREIVLSHRPPNYAESTFFSRRCGWDDVVTRDQLRRMTQVLRLQSIAGSTVDREAAVVERDKAVEVCEKESPKLLAKIEALQKQVDAQDRDKRLATKRCEEQTAAVVQLRELAPSHIAGEHNSTMTSLGQTVGTQLGEAKVRLNELETLLDASRYPSERTHLEALQRSFPNAVIELESSGYIKRQLSDQWPKIRSAMESELSELRLSVDAMQADFDAAKVEALAKLDYYAA